VKFFVTGGNGFIGSAVVTRLARAGHDVVCLLRDSSDTSRIAGLPFERARGDVRDAACVRQGMRGCDLTLHLAAPGGWARDDESTLFDVIVGGTRNVLDAAREHTGHRVIVVSSTAAINGAELPTMFDEHSAFTLRDPALTYAHAKVAAEREARRAFEAGVDVVIVNPAEVYGPGDTALGTARNLIDFARATPVLVCDGGTGVVHVDDVAAGILAAAAAGRSGERYILSGGNVSIHQLAELVLRVLGRQARVVQVPRAVVRLAARLAVRLRVPMPFDPHVVPYASRYWFVDNTKAQRELGLSFRRPAQTIGSTMDWLAATGRL